jgi:hypothetical protein
LSHIVESTRIKPADPIGAMPMPKAPGSVREPKASRVRVWQAVERIVQSGRRPTVEGVRELLGGGSPNSVTAYINEWYEELGDRLAAADTPMPGLPREAVSLLAELWRVASGSRAGAGEPSTAADELRDAERAALVAETRALDTLNRELQKHRASAEKSLAEARALLARREAALDEERANAAAADQALMQTRLALEVALERQRLAPSRVSVARRAARLAPRAKNKKAPTRAPKKRTATKAVPGRVAKSRANAARSRAGVAARTKRR